jgi:hypothetical protein
VTIAHQARDFIDLKNKAASLQVANLIVLRVIYKDAQELAGQFDCTPPPPEVIGHRAVLTYKHDVVEHLVRNGHRDKGVNAFVQLYLKQAYQLLRQKTIVAVVESGIFSPGASLCPDEVSLLIQTLNSLLYQAMAEKQVATALTPEFLIICSKVWGWTHLFRAYYEDVLFPGNKAFLDPLCSPDFLTFAMEVHQTLVRQEAYRDFLGCGNTQQYEEFVKCLDFLKGLRYVMQILADDPVMGDSGQTVPLFDKPRT